MKAVLKEARGVGNVVCKEIDEPTPGPKELKVKVKATGICGTDIHIYHERFKYNPPVVIGHEFGGEVVEVGSEVKNFKVGDRVTAEAPAVLCGECRYCRSGNYNLCSNRLGLGWGINGSFAEYCVIEEKMTHRIPDNVDLTAAALCEPLACVCHAVLELTRVSVNDLVVVSGPGPIGLLTLQVAKAEGARVAVCGVTLDKERLELAKKLGADYVFDVMKTNISEEIQKLTEGYGADVVFECSGNENSVNQCLDIIKKGGQYTQVGLFGRKISIDFEKVATKEIKVTGSQSQKYTAWEKALDLLSRNLVDVKSLVSAELPLCEWEKGFEMIENKVGLKVLLIPEK